MKPSIRDARRRRTGIGQATVERAEAAPPEVVDRPSDWNRMLAARMADLDVARAESRLDVKKLAAQWRRQAHREREEGYPRRGLFLDSAADALEGWADKVFSSTTLWPGL